MSLQASVEHVFGSQGALAAANADFKPRVGQTQMAVAVAEVIEQGGALVVEAGTGVGKTFAYLVPALLSGERVLVSTATKALQDQIFLRDLPFLRKALGISLRAALLKGRSSYLCPYRLELAEAELDGAPVAEVRWVGRVRHWSATTRTGDMSEMPGFQERSPYLSLVTSTRENCLGSQCPQFAQCHVNKARKQALAADLVVINHHLFFADMQVRESGMAELLPSARAIVIDEAHQFNETGVNFLGEQWSNAQLQDFARETLRTCNKLARGLGDWTQLIYEVDQACQRWVRALGERSNQRLAWLGSAPEGVEPTQWQTALAEQADALQALNQALQGVSAADPELARLQERCVQHAHKARLFGAAARSGRVRWVEMGGLLARLIESPLDIAEEMRSHWGLAECEEKAQEKSVHEEERPAPVWASNPTPSATSASVSVVAATEASTNIPAVPSDAPSEADALWQEIAASLHADLGDIASWGDANEDPPWDDQELEARAAAAAAQVQPHKAWIFTSATLGADTQLSHFTQSCGLEGARVLQVPSPFDYARQSMLYIPEHMPDPRHVQAHGQAVAELAAQAAQALGGRTLVLTTTLKALQHIGQAVRQQLLACDHIEVLLQGEQSKQRLMEQFRSPGPDKGYVLVASATFWEGFDVPGDALQFVVIDKLPFPPPHDPLVQARARRYEEQGQSPFARLFVPEAAIALKQGAGRLIRTETDKGILALCDVRVLHKNYGQQLLNSLPPMARIRSRTRFEQALQRLAQLRAEA